MEKQQNYIDDLSEIRNIMERSSRFVSLSGLSGILVGLYALIGAYMAYKTFYFSDELIYSRLRDGVISTNVIKLVAIAFVVLILALGSAIGLSYRKAKKNGLPIWDNTAKLLFVNLFIPLISGGIFIVIMFSKGAIGLVAPSTLLFYGLALVNASKYTFNDIRYLGIAEIALGLMSAYFIGYGLLFWAIGFGVLHIIYGLWMYFKYEK
ncbi:MAG: hypothetical protein OEW67_14490 [Cyclobacteriaceae bacterium]|nr:hypothetical protein [Cyclobacteriaceae bacterium]